MSGFTLRRVVSDVTRILEAIQAGQTQAAEKLLPLVYDELRRIAAAKMAQERPGQTLQPTALVHEAWLRLGGDAQPAWQNRAHFLGAAAEAMRRILVDRARKRATQKHGGGWERVDEADWELPIADEPERLLRIHEVLDELAAEEPLRAEVVKLHCFVGLTHAEIAEALEVSERTVKRYWTYALARLQQALER